MYGKERKINKQLCGHIGRSHFIPFWIQLHHVSKRSRRARVCSWYVRVRMHNFSPPVWNRFLLSSSETFLSPFRATRPKKTGFFMQLHTWTQEYYKGSDEKNGHKISMDALFDLLRLVLDWKIKFKNTYNLLVHFIFSNWFSCTDCSTYVLF